MILPFSCKQCKSFNQGSYVCMSKVTVFFVVITEGDRPGQKMSRQFPIYSGNYLNSICLKYFLIGSLQTGEINHHLKKKKVLFHHLLYKTTVITELIKCLLRYN